MRFARRSVLLPLMAIAGSGCVYYNAMWSAERLASDARHQEASGQPALAKLSWARAAVKAESIAIRHPDSRWADDARVLQVEGLAHSGGCVQIDEPMARALASVSDVALRERLALAGARCAIARDNPHPVPDLLVDVLNSTDGDRRSAAFYLLGQSAVAQADWSLAIDAFGKSREPSAEIARTRALIAAGRIADARATLPALAGRKLDDSLWISTLDEIARAAGDSVASAALDSLLAQAKLRSASKARLLLADGDRLRHAGQHGAATARYETVRRLVPDSIEASQAEVRALYSAAGAASGVADLAPLSAAVDRLLTRGGFAQQEAMALQRILGVVRTPDSSDIGWFRAGEIARDTLVAPAVAADWFAKIPRVFPGSLFAPKALIALALVRPATVDSVRAVLDSSYPQSPYTLALRGDLSLAYGALEDSLAQALGVLKGRPGLLFARGVGGPTPGRKGPQLDPTDAVTPGKTGAAAARPAAPAGRRAAPVRPPAGPGQPRPGSPSDDRP